MPAAEDELERCPIAVTQSPTANAAMVTDLVWENPVLAVKVTVTCPVAGSCTSTLLPEIAAAMP